MERDFFRPDYYSDGKEKAGLSSEQEKKYINLVSRAREAKAYPYQSGYHVRAAALAKDGTVYAGGNKEYALSDAFAHGETAVISGLKDLTDSPIEALAWYLESKNDTSISQEYGRPCGNCRDVMSEYCGADFVLLTGNEKGMVYTKLKDFLFEDFSSLELAKVDRRAAGLALKAARKSVDVYLPDALKLNTYGAVLISEYHNIWAGSLYSNAGFDSVTPVLSAVLSWRNSYPEGKISDTHLRLKKLVIASPYEVPSPFYRDRQAILEIDEILRRYTGKTNPLPVEIVHATFNDDDKIVPVDARITNTEEWLPHPFTPGAFRMDDVIKSELGGLMGADSVKNLGI